MQKRQQSKMLNIHISTIFLFLMFVWQYSAQKIGSINEQKCKEYSKNIKSCDVSEGVAVQYGEFPHMASLGYIINKKIAYSCSGVLISEQYILTPAHCGYSKYTGPPVKVRLGVLHFEDVTNETHFQDIRITNIIRHPMYNVPIKYNDIALVKLEHPVEINEYVRPACLPDLNEIQNEYIVTAWNVYNDEDQPYTPYLEKNSNIFEISNKECNSVYKSSRRNLKNGIITESQLCAGPPEIVCRTLAGAPLQTLNTKVKCMYNIHGLASLGPKCPTGKPTIFTKIAPFIEWIESIVWA